MNFPPVEIASLAQAEMMESYEFYESRKSGLGDDFIDEIGLALHRMFANPGIGKWLRKGIRRVLVRRFPVAVIYRDSVDPLEVIAVFHTSRNPAVWKKRI